MTNCQTQRGEGTKKNDFLHISGFLCEILSRNTFESCSCSWAGGRRTQPALSQKVNKSIINSVLIILWSSSQTAAVQNTSRLPCAWLLSNSVKHYICVNVCHRFGHALSFNVFLNFFRKSVEGAEGSSCRTSATKLQWLAEDLHRGQNPRHVKLTSVIATKVLPPSTNASCICFIHENLNSSDCFEMHFSGFVGYCSVSHCSNKATIEMMDWACLCGQTYKIIRPWLYLLMMSRLFPFKIAVLFTAIREWIALNVILIIIFNRNFNEKWLRWCFLNPVAPAVFFDLPIWPHMKNQHLLV